jgi:hypothetical protein
MAGTILVHFDLGLAGQARGNIEEREGHYLEFGDGSREFGCSNFSVRS